MWHIICIYLDYYICFNFKNMESLEIHSLNQLHQAVSSNNKSFLLLYKSNTETGNQALAEFTRAAEKVTDIRVMHADVKTVRDIHPRYSINSAPSLLEFEKDKLKNVYKGVQSAAYYNALFEDAVYIAQAEKSGKPLKRVTVYSTPTCSWCNTLKSYLRQHKIRFNDVDVSRDPSLAQELVKRSGQQGVPQTDINGQIIVGFDKPKINRLLEIKEHV